ncbi:hypothetical protein WMZ97_09475 [Lentibacillus sp. N15]
MKTSTRNPHIGRILENIDPGIRTSTKFSKTSTQGRGHQSRVRTST